MQDSPVSAEETLYDVVQIGYGPVSQEKLLSIEWSRDSVSGGPEVNFVHQPSLEAQFRAEVAKLPNTAPDSRSTPSARPATVGALTARS